MILCTFITMSDTCHIVNGCIVSIKLAASFSRSVKAVGYVTAAGCGVCCRFLLLKLAAVAVLCYR